MVYEHKTDKRKFLEKHEHSNDDIFHSVNANGDYYSERIQLIESGELVSKFVFNNKKEVMTEKAKKEILKDKKEANKNFKNKTIAHILT